MAKDNDLTPAFTDLITSGQAESAAPAEQPKEPEPKKLAYKTISIGMTGEELAEVMRIAQELGQPRHAVLKYAIAEFIRRYNEGERPAIVMVPKLK